MCACAHPPPRAHLHRRVSPPARRYNRGTALQYDSGSNTWTPYTINAAACPDPDQPPAPLVPRDSGYTLGVMFGKGQGGGDRLLVLGGNQDENNVYYSDDCGRTWSCFDGVNIWDPRSFAPLIHPQGIFPGDPLFMLGGDIEEVLPSIGIFANTGDGTSNWVRPLCDGVSGCPYDCDDPVVPGYCDPDSPVYPGQAVSDWTTMWLFMDAPSPLAGSVFWLNSTNYATTGWTPLASPIAPAVTYGRRVFVKGPNSGSGCFFATDFTAIHLWNTAAGNPDATSTNNFVTSRSAGGPWVPGVAPWAPRGSAVVVTSEKQDKIWVGGGFTFTNGVPSAPVYGDVWTVDGSVCLLGANGQQCTDPTHVSGPPDMDNLLCNCAPQWQGDDRCGSCSPGSYGPTCASTCGGGASGNGFCNADLGWGLCNPQSGCVCTGQHVNGPAAACDACTASFWGASCAACPACDPAHTVGGACDGSGTTGGTGLCLCEENYEGPTCSQAIPAFLPSPTPNPPAPAPATLSAGAAAAVALVVVSLSAAGGLFVWGRFLGGGPTLSAAFAKITSLGSSSGVERTSLLSTSSARAANVPSKVPAMTPSQLASRFGSTPSRY